MRARFFKNTSDKRWGYGRIRQVRCYWLGPLFVLVTPKRTAS